MKEYDTYVKANTMFSAKITEDENGKVIKIKIIQCEDVLSVSHNGIIYKCDGSECFE